MMNRRARPSQQRPGRVPVTLKRDGANTASNAR
jgi:hypothetical protein